MTVGTHKPYYPVGVVAQLFGLLPSALPQNFTGLLDRPRKNRRRQVLCWNFRQLRSGLKWSTKGMEPAFWSTAFITAEGR